MRIRISLIVIVMMLYGCQQITPIERLQDEVPMTKSTNTDLENTDSKCYYWCGDVKIPLIINDDKLYVLAETAKIEKLTRTAMITRSTLIATEVSENYSALGLKSSLSDCGPLERTSLILDNAMLDDIEADDIIYAAADTFSGRKPLTTFTITPYKGESPIVAIFYDYYIRSKHLPYASDIQQEITQRVLELKDGLNPSSDLYSEALRTLEAIHTLQK